MAPRVSEVLRAVQVLLLKVLRALPKAVESELLLAPSSRGRQASRLEAPPRVQEPASWAPLEQSSPQALPAQQEPQAHSVWQRQAQRLPAKAPRAPPASSALPWQPLPWFLFPLW
jgi:hypothetical protein